jgi:hypothetical protein
MGSYSDIPQISLPQSADWVARVRESAEYNMKRYESCSQSILAAFMGEFGIEDPPVMASAGATMSVLFVDSYSSLSSYVFRSNREG